MEKIFLIFILILSITINLISSQEDIVFSEESGFYLNDFLLALSTPSETLKIFYTTDGSDPTKSNTTKEYTSPIQVIDRSQEPNIYSNYEEDLESPLSVSTYYKYKKPPFLIDKAMVVRAVSKKGDNYGNIASKTYFITKNELSQFQRFTVISLVTNPENLFDPDNGIYIVGNRFIEWKKDKEFDPDSDYYYDDMECNYYMRGSEWEKEASISIFEDGKITIEQNVGIRMRGFSSRDLPQKSFNVFARKKYGKKTIKSSTLFPNNKDINGNLITEYNSISLRAVPDEERSRDYFVNRIIHDRNLQTAYDMKECFLFLNGEFWGMYVITEKYSGDFFASHYNIPKEDVLFNKDGEIDESTPQEIIDIYNFMDVYSKKDLSNEVYYKEVCELLDIDTLIELYSTGIFIANTDWPGHNFGIWKYNAKNKTKDNKYEKWRFMAYDFDYSMGNVLEGDFGSLESYQYDMFKFIQKSKDEYPTNLFLSLFKNKEFKSKFIKSYENFVTNAMSMNIINPIIQKFNEDMSIFVGYSYSRWWGYLGGSKKEGIMLLE